VAIARCLSGASIHLARLHCLGDEVKAIVGLLMAATLLFAAGCAKTDWIDRTLVTENVSGVWTGSMVSLDGQPMVSLEVRLALQQKATKVTGSIDMGGNLGTLYRGSSTIEGTVASDVFTFKDARAIVTGELTIDGDEMKGHGLTGNSRRVAITLRRIAATAPASSPPR
jgi:hypothetical protein